jgi:uncharacterized protein
MRIERFDDPTAFYERVEGFLAAREPEHNLLLGLRSGLERDPRLWGDDDPVLLACAAGAAVVGVAVRTAPFNLVLSEIDDLACVDAIAEALDGAVLPGVTAPKAVARRFAAAWAARTGAEPQVDKEERIYAATEIDTPRGVPGEARRYTDADHAIAVDLLHAFFEEAMPGSVEANAEAFLRRRAASGDVGLRFWDDGGPVSIAGFGNPTPNGMRVGPVYTPPERRGRGYASALTAAVSLEILRTKRFCFLFTDLANATSNAIYQRIGYRPVSDVTMMTF